MNAPVLINDATRQRYLREMGVAVYFPRRPLPGAAVSRRYRTDTHAGAGDDTHESVAMGKETPGIPRQGGSPAGLDGLKDSLAAGPSAAPASRTPPPGVRRAEPAWETGEALAFRFTWFRPDDRLVVVAGHDEARLPARYLQMLQRILAALSPGYRDLALQGEPFHWPLDADMPGDVETARQVVRAFLRRRCGGTPPPFMLILMDEPPRWLFPADAVDVASALLEPVSVPGLSEQILRVPSLKTMAGDASVKRPAWEAMQSLIRPLAQIDQG